MNIDIQQPRLIPLRRQQRGEVHRDRAFAHPALVAHDEDLVFDAAHVLFDHGLAVIYMYLVHVISV